MPMYEYACDACQHEFETLIRNPSDEAELVCPKCGTTTVQKKFSVPGRPKVAAGASLPTACATDGPPCGAPWCKRV